MLQNESRSPELKMNTSFQIQKNAVPEIPSYLKGDPGLILPNEPGSSEIQKDTVPEIPTDINEEHLMNEAVNEDTKILQNESGISQYIMNKSFKIEIGTVPEIPTHFDDEYVLNGALNIDMQIAKYFRLVVLISKIVLFSKWRK